ncbi:hypothetical protein F4774DRAFT_423630 [Daldinia eschscholtzii]|nr:hypothetical protein F4774DRAFT_423630 [Daldinia eschscholtzii]
MLNIADALAVFPVAKRDKDLDGPAMEAPAGVHPNLANPNNQNAMAMSIITLCMVLSIILVLSRAYTRIFCIRKVHIEDFLLALSLIFFVMFSCCEYIIIDKPGMFIYQWEMSFRSQTHFLWLGHLDENFYVIIVGCLKSSILLDWVRIFVPIGTRNLFFWTCHILLWLNLILYGVCIIAFNIECFPHRKIWDKTIEEGWCFPPMTLMLATGVFNFVSDFIILLAPQCIIWKLRMSPGRKLTISLVFAMGLFCMIFAACRIALSARTLHQYDMTHDISEMFLWVEGEITALFFVACLPSVPKAAKGVKSKSMLWISRLSITPLTNTKRTKEYTSWPYPRHITRNTRSYRMVDEYSLSPMDNSQNAQFSNHVHTTKDVNSPTGIIRTTEFCTMEERILSPPGQKVYHPPWV